MPGSDWVECWNCGGHGRIEDEDEDWQGFYQCDICEGVGGWKLVPGSHSIAMEDDPGM